MQVKVKDKVIFKLTIQMRPALHSNRFHPSVEQIHH